MAIKGKRKSQRKPRTTSSARSRPSGAVRPVAPRAKSAPFYRTFRGQLTSIIVVLVLVGVAMWFFSDRAAQNERLSKRQDELASLTREVRGYLEDVNQSIREMAGAPFNTSDASQLDNLDESSEKWVEDFQAAGALAGALQGPEGVRSAGQVLFQAFQTYSSAARTYGMVPGADKKMQQDLLERAGEMRAAGNELVAAAVQIIDQERADADMEPSGIASPATLTPIVPTPAPAEDGDDGGGAGGKKKRGDKGDD